MSLALFLFGIATSVVGAVFWQGYRDLRQKVIEFRSGYTGEWFTNIFDEHGEIVKVDRIKIRQYREILSGTIHRQKPDSETHREWRFTGRVRGNDFFAIFWGVDSSMISCGCWYVHQQTDDHFEGHYLRLASKGSEVTTIPLHILRKQKFQRPSVLGATWSVIYEAVGNWFKKKAS